MSHRLPITVRLESFEGPLDLLLYLIQTHEFDISTISISKITDQYLSYVRLMQELNFDIASDFLVMAATLLHWKSKAILPQERTEEGAAAEEEAFTQEDLIRQLLEHQRFRAAGEDLAQLPKLGEDVFTRPNHKPPIERVWKEMNVTDLATTFQDILVRARRRTQLLKKETISLSTKIVEMADRLEVGRVQELKSLMSLAPARVEVVVTFLASLELSRLRKMRVYQEGGVYSPIFVELLESLMNFDVNLARGFDSIEAAADAKAVKADIASAPPQAFERGEVSAADLAGMTPANGQLAEAPVQEANGAEGAPLHATQENLESYGKETS
jgi:segregation and condensation protein A